MSLRLSVLFAAVLHSVVAVASPPALSDAQVLIVGTWHFDNPGLDIHNMDSDDVLAPSRQQEIAAVLRGLNAFAPTLVAVESPADAVAAPFAAWRAGTLSPAGQRNEIVQLGFRLAAMAGLDGVIGIDMPGEFPMQAVGQWAGEHDRQAQFAALMQRAGDSVAATGRLLSQRSIGAVLRHLNAPTVIAEGQALYLELLRYGAGVEQPGAELNAAWQRRNLLICARLLQSVKPGDRAVVFYGQGHVHALQRCVLETPGVRLVAANDYLPR